MQPIKVLIVDDSAVVRQVLTEQLKKDPMIDVIGAAADPIFAHKRMQTNWPDVIVLDIEMPRMDGITFLKQIMAERPTPVVICSTLTEKGAETTFAAMQAGAVSIITKPKAGLKDFLQDSANDVTSAVKGAAKAQLRNNRRAPAIEKVQAPTRSMQTTQKLVAIGTSTGGTQALEAVLTALPRLSPAIVIVQHMPEKFTSMFAERLNQLCNIQVKEAQHGDRVMPGLALIAPGGKHMSLHRNGAQYVVHVKDGPLVNRHKPSVDVLFKSVAEQASSNAVGFILTGMGDDGARGLKLMRNAGALTFAQDEASCVVFGMPKEAIALGGAEKIIALNKVPNAIMSSVEALHI